MLIAQNVTVLFFRVSLLFQLVDDTIAISFVAHNRGACYRWKKLHAVTSQL